MATPSEKLAQSLEALHALQEKGIIAIQAADLTRVHRERLLKHGFLKEVIKGWYIPSRPDEVPGDSTAWYASYWHFCADYLNARFDDDWCLSPEQSLLLHAGNWTVPLQLLVRTPKGNNKVTALPHNTSLFDVRYAMPDKKHIEKKEGLCLYSIEAALVACSQKFFTEYPTDARTILSMQRDASALLALLLEGGHSTIAGRLAGAFRNIGNDRIADDIVKTMQSADFNVRETDPFDVQLTLASNSRERSPYVNRMGVAWQAMRDQIIKSFPKPPGMPSNIKAYLKQVDDNYVTDAYHSLSIEGYRVSRELIERVRSGSWNPDNHEDDKNHKNALAARGYWQAFQVVKKSIHKVLENSNPGEMVEDDHGDWYREMFGPSVTSGILSIADLSGYRNGPVYIRGSMHVPPSHEAIRDMMPAFFKLLKEEEAPAVRVILGHFFFAFIHPYMDGNGRMSRFLMNVMLASAGYPWTVVPVEKRSIYMKSLEEASVQQNIMPFCKFIASLLA